MNIRPAVFEDSDFVWRLSNRPSVRELSTRNEAYTFEQHQEWWAKRFGEPTTRIWIAFEAHSKFDGDDEEHRWISVGYVRYSRALEGQPLWSGGPNALMDSPAEVSIAISPDHRRKGYAKQLLTETRGPAIAELGGESIHALVLPKNRESIALFTSCGFDYLDSEMRMGKEHNVYFWRAPYWEYEMREWPVFA